MNSQNHPPKKWQFKALVATAAFCLIGSAAWSQTTATVSVNASSVIAPVPPQGYGVNAAIYDADVISSQLPATFEAGGITAVRYPGGSYSDCYHWQANTGTPSTDPPDYPGCSLYITPGASFESFMTTDVNPAGAHAIVTVNYGSNIAGTGGGDPSEAAAWVQYANVTNNWNVTYWEIGNEVGGNGYFGNPGWEFDLHYPYNGDREGQPSLSPAAYAQNTLAYISAMKAVDPNIKIGIGVWCPDTNNTNPQMFNVLAKQIDFLIVHWYPGSAALSAELSLASDVANVRNEIAAAGGNRNIPFAITETNADGAFSTALDAVWNVDNYLTWFENGAVNVDYWELFDSDGFLSSPTAPLDPYYAVQFSNTLAGVGNNLVTTSSTNSLLRSHAVTRSDGSVAVLLLNEDTSNSDTVSVSISGASLSSSGTRYTLNASSGTTSSSISGIGNSFSVTVPASTAIGIHIPAGACTPTAIIPEMNVGGTWTQESSATVTSTTAVVDLGPQPLTGGSWSWTGPNGYTSTSREIDSIPLSAGTNVYTATYTNTSGCTSTQAFTITVGSGSSTLIANGTYIITGVGSGLAIDDPDFSTKDGEDLDIYTVNDGTNQQWTVTNVSTNVITLTNGSSGQLVDVAGDSKSSGALVDQWPGNGQTNQEWNVISLGGGAYELTSVNSGLALSVIGAGTGKETGLEQLTYSGSTSQQWKFTSY